MRIYPIDEHSIQIDSPAKINLFLHVLAKRDDGYHDIDSIFQAVDLFDSLAVVRTDAASELRVEGAPALAATPNNLVVRAWELMKSTFDLRGGCQFVLTKRIPIAAGLGGGSGNAAAALAAINRLWRLELSRAHLSSLGLRLGSDVPFFFSSGQAQIGGRGERINETLLRIDYSILMINNGIAISTKAAYDSLTIALTPPRQQVTFKVCRSGAELIGQLAEMRNDFEAGQMLLHPALAEAARWLKLRGAQLVRMTGTGSTLFGLWDGDLPAQIEDEARKFGWSAYAVRPVRFEAD